MGITKTNYQKLQKYEQIFLCAVKSDYATCDKKTYMKMLDDYYGMSALKAPAMSGWNCSKCRLKEIKKIGTEYFIYKEKEDKE